jgi:hypothetical protein
MSRTVEPSELHCYRSIRERRHRARLGRLNGFESWRETTESHCADFRLFAERMDTEWTA